MKESLASVLKLDRPLHHAYCLVGGRQRLLDELFSVMERDFGVSRKGNPDLWFKEFELFGIEASRFLKEMQSRTAAGGGKKFFVIAVNSVTTEAGNALLKVLEEPTAGTHFFFVAPRLEVFLPTVRSRLRILDAGNTEDIQDKTCREAEKFLAASLSSRILFVKSLVNDFDSGGRGGGFLLEFLSAVEAIMRKKFPPALKEAGLAYEALYRSRRYLSGRAPSVKMLLEYIAVTLPVI